MQDPTNLDGIALRPTTSTVDLSALAHNVALVRGRVGSRKIMGIVKANAYGHGLVPVSKAMLERGVDELGVAFLEEGIALRRAGIDAPILVLGGLIGNQISHFIEHDLAMTASSPYKLRQIDEVAQVTGRRAKVHLKIDTGMERIGVHWENAQNLFDAAMAAKSCDIDGVFTHFASADSASTAFTRTQLERFTDALDRQRRRGFAIPRVHAANSGAVMQHEAALFDLVRVGAALYGFSGGTAPKSLDVKPILTLTTRVGYFKVVRAGSPVSYDGTFVAPKDTRVVTLPVGYGDGYMRALSNKAEVLIAGRRHPVIGAVTMDATMVDIGGSSAFNGDEVVLIGAQGRERVTVEELAARAGTIPYEILTSINTRVPRRYV